MAARNPIWNRDELILALDLYLRWAGNPPGQASEEIIGLSQLLNELGRQADSQPTYRNPNGVYMKIMNFRRFDPSYASTGRKGLQRGNKLEEEVWADFHDDPEHLRETASRISQVIANGEVPHAAPEDDEEVMEAREGRILTRLHRRRERSRKLVAKKKAQSLKKHGRLECEACGFDFEERYGERGKGFIEAHHIKPVHTLTDDSKTRLNDLVLLCANCHRMVHATRPWLGLEGLQALVKAASVGQTDLSETRRPKG